MRLDLCVEIDDSYLQEFLDDCPGKTLEDLKSEINNACYLGLDCTSAILMRLFDFPMVETYIEEEER
jgi:hypothetical protein